MWTKDQVQGHQNFKQREKNRIVHDEKKTKKKNRSSEEELVSANAFLSAVNYRNSAFFGNTAGCNRQIELFD